MRAALLRLHLGHSGLLPLAAVVLGLSCTVTALRWVLKRIVGCADDDERVAANDPFDQPPT